VKHLTVFLALLANIALARENFPGTNALAYYTAVPGYEEEKCLSVDTNSGRWRKEEQMKY
jgi:hypothetical protein